MLSAWAVGSAALRQIGLNSNRSLACGALVGEWRRYTMMAFQPLRASPHDRQQRTSDEKRVLHQLSLV